MTHEQQKLMAAIEKDPAAPGPRNAYADWLDKRADHAAADADTMGPDEREEAHYARLYASESRAFARQLRTSTFQPKLKVGDRVRVLRQKPNSNWARGRTGRIHEIIEFAGRYYPHEPGVCYEVQLDDPEFAGRKVGLTKRTKNAVGEEVDVPRTYPFSEEALEKE